ncbi:MAG TPA: MotA/TolQ/ExbB proton channel family protein [Phycisphaerales bacterium]|nr:MotA/TolQ/ExbB proton channel family protein [Phycisphaerales bacterium]
MVETLLALAAGVLAIQDAPAPDATPDKTLVQYVAEGGTIGYIIIGLSFTGVVLAVAALVRLRRSKLAPEEDVSALDRMLRAGSVEQALNYCASPEHDSFLTRVMGAALLRCSRSPFGLLELRTALEESGQQEVARLHRSTDAIGLIASVAPMLGLLGTVVGMVLAFETLGLGGGVAKPGQLAGSISLALITTVQGLVVAIPATAVHSYFRNRIDGLATEVGELIEELAAHVEQGAAPAEQPAAAQAGARAKAAPKAPAAAQGAGGA